MNVRRPPFDDPRVRRALVLAMDRDGLANRVTQGMDFPAQGGMVPPGVAGHVPGIALPYDPAVARQEMAAAGYPGGQDLPTVTVNCPPEIGMSLVADSIAAGWRENLGLHVSFERPEAYLDLRERADIDLPDLWFSGYRADYPDPDNFLRSAGVVWATGWHDAEYDALVEAARRVADQGQRMALYRQAEQILVDQAPIVPISYGRLHTLVKPWLPTLPNSTVIGTILKDIIIQVH